MRLCSEGKPHLTQTGDRLLTSTPPTIMPEYRSEHNSLSEISEVQVSAGLKVVQEKKKRQRLSPEDIIYALEMSIACAISYSIITYCLALFVNRASDFLGGMWASVATVFVFRDTRANSLSAGLARLIATCVSFALCLLYLVLFSISACRYGSADWRRHRDNDAFGPA
jgi:hypothetical protein